jgi:outer membrane protein assembly factor BamD (BamD/ComL family)
MSGRSATHKMLVCAGLLALTTPALAQDDTRPVKGLSLGQVADTQKDPVREKLDASVRLLRSEDYGQAASQLFGFVEDNSKFKEEAQYNLAKSLYRMGLLHSSLHYFSGLLSQGPKNRFYSSSLEWSLFIGRKMVDDNAVNELVAKFSNGNFPEEYRDEFYFRLARFHYVRALAIESGEISGDLGEEKVQEKSTGGLSISGDMFGDDPFADPPEDEAKPKKKKGLSIDEDIFGFGDDEPAPKKKKRKKKKKSKAKKRRATKGKLALTPQEHIESASRFVKGVKNESEFGARARFLEALIAYKTGKENQALKAFKTVVGLTSDSDTRADRTLREAAFFQLARTHFGAQQPTFSTFYYSKVDRDSFEWLDSLYEASWAEFRLGDYEKALGNLLTVHAPFFTEQYYPESHILKAVIYYENCRYPEAKTILTDFLGRYEPVLKELERLATEPQSADEYYAILKNLKNEDLVEAGTSEGRILAQVLDIALADPELTRLDASHHEVSDELEQVRGNGALSGTGLADTLDRLLEDARTALARDAGRAVKNKLQRERGSIKGLIQQAIRIDIETSRSEQERIESQLREVQSRPKSIEKEFVEWADDEKLVWPFEGEYWRDELGTYELTLAHSCR